MQEYHKNGDEFVDESKPYEDSMEVEQTEPEVTYDENNEVEEKVTEQDESNEVNGENDVQSDEENPRVSLIFFFINVKLNFTTFDQIQSGDPDAENISEDELPSVQVAKVPETEEVSDEELPGPKRAELPADTEVY